MTESLKVPKDKFEKVIKALLNTPPLPMADIPRKRKQRRLPATEYLLDHVQPS